METKPECPINEGGCMQPTPPSFDKELEHSIQRSVTHLIKAQQVQTFVKRNKNLFEEMHNLGIRFYIE